MSTYTGRRTGLEPSCTSKRRRQEYGLRTGRDHQGCRTLTNSSRLHQDAGHVSSGNSGVPVLGKSGNCNTSTCWMKYGDKSQNAKVYSTWIDGLYQGIEHAVGFRSRVGTKMATPCTTRTKSRHCSCREEVQGSRRV
ncbi:hypothetical protein P3T76_014913 [Phytophthora citrophthora]|uniref:Uncharacterized protein n=1 Tax=Phytophthora citrophthora TaxID=4793 RepID=A0AAD9G0M9_9STRA|nr:hypothetical protein P3T76_014913 [Phytophthora citrophthora]